MADRPTALLTLMMAAALTPLSVPKPSQLDLQTLACLEELLENGSIKKESLKDKAIAVVNSVSASEDKKDDTKDVEPKPLAMFVRYCGSNYDDPEETYMAHQRENRLTGQKEFTFFCQFSSGGARLKYESDIMRGMKNCRGVKADVAYNCATRLLSQPSIDRMAIKGLHEYVRYITPEEPVCVDDLMISASDEPIPALDKVKDGPLKVMKTILRDCITDIITARFPGDKTKDARRKTETGLKAHFSCNWFERVINRVQNQKGDGEGKEAKEIVPQSWITECMRMSLPSKQSGIDAEQFKLAYGSDTEESTQQLNVLIAGIRCSTSPAETATDLYSALSLAGGPVSKRVKNAIDNLMSYVDCFWTAFKESDVSLGDLIGCTAGAGQYEKTRECTRRAKEAKASGDPLRLDFPATGDQLKEAVEKQTVFKFIHKRICKTWGRLKWIAEHPAEVAKATGDRLKIMAKNVLTTLLTVIFVLLVISVVLGSVAGLLYLTSIGFVPFGFLAFLEIYIIFDKLGFLKPDPMFYRGADHW